MGSKAEDPIGHLPREIMAHILSYFTTKEAVATSILSKSWRFRWTESTTFDAEGSSEVPFVDKVLPKINVGTIRKFRLRWTDDYSEAICLSAISAIPQMLKVLQVLDMASATKASLPPEIYGCTTLEVMKLDGSFFIQLPGSVCLPKLAELELNSVEYKSDETFHKLIASCPVLRSLTVKRTSLRDNLRTCIISSPSLKRLCIYFEDSSAMILPRNGAGKLKIDAPTLKYLVLHDSMLKEVSIEGETSVNEVDLDIYIDGQTLEDEDYDIPLSLDDMTVGLLETFHRVESLKVSKSVLTALTTTGRNLPPSFTRVTKLAVEYYTNQLSYVADLIDRCANLQVLEMCDYGFHSSSSTLQRYPDQYPYQYPRCLFESLKQVTFTPFWSFDMETIKLVLNHGVMLESVNLCFDKMLFDEEGDLDPRERIHEEILMMNKASPNCNIYTS